jgi:hypothetical protein
LPNKAKLVTRAETATSVTVDSIPKGSGLTNAELDSNFINLRDQTIAITGDTGTVDVAAGDTITFSGATVSGNTVTITGGGGSGLSNVVEDTTPQLGGNLDINNFNIVSDSENIKIIPGPIGRIQLDNGIWPLENGAPGQYLKTDGAGYDDVATDGSAPDSLSWAYPTGSLTFEKSTGITPASTGADTIVTGAADHDTYFRTSGNGTFNFRNTTSNKGLSITDSGLTLGGTASSELTVLTSTDELYLMAGGGIEIVPGGTTKIKLDNNYWPNVDGTNGQVLTTNGSGVLSWTTSSGGTANLDNLQIADTTLSPVNTNDDLILTANGSGKIQLDTERIYLGPVASGTLSFSGAFAANVGPQTLYRNSAASTTLNSGNIYPNARNAEIILNADVTTANRARMTDAVDLDLNGNSWSSTSGGAGPAHGKFITVINSEATTESLGVIKALDLGISFPAGTNAGSTINATSVYGARTLFQLSTGANDTVNITNHYGYYYGSTFQSSNNGTTTLGSEYGFYVANPIGAQVSTNRYGFYAASDAYNNRLGGINLYNNTIQAADTNDNLTISNNGTGYLQLNAVQFPAGDGTNGQVLATNGAGVLSWTTGSGTMSNVVEDTTPQLGGNLDVNGNSIVSVSNADITLEPNGVGNVNVRADTLVLGDNNDISYITGYQNGSYSDIQISPHTSNHGIIRVRGLNEDLVIQPDGSGKIQLDNNYWPNADGTAGQTLSTNGSGVLSWVTPSAGGAVDPITFVGDDSTGTAVNTGETFKIAGATGITTAVSGDTLTITGTAQDFAFASLTSTPTTVSGYGITDAFSGVYADLTSKPTTIAGYGITDAFANVVEDTTPQLGGDLDVQTRIITTSTTNGNVKLAGDGTGRVIIGTDPTDGSTGFYGNNAVYGAQMNYENTAWNAATGPQYPNPLTRSTDWTLDASTTTAGGIRVLDAVELDMAGYDWNFSTNYYSGPQQQKSLVLKNTGSSASNTLDNAIVNFNKAEIQGSGSNNSTITVNQIFGERIQTTANQDSGDTTNIGTNFGLHYQSPANYGSGTLNVTNEYGLYMDMASSTATNNTAIQIQGSIDNGITVDQNSANNKLGGIQFQYNRAKFPGFASTPGTVSSLAWVYAKGTGAGGAAQLYFKDGLGYETLFTPHNQKGEWEYFSRNTDTGKVVRINMEEMIRDLEQLTGKTYIKDE